MTNTETTDPSPPAIATTRSRQALVFTMISVMTPVLANLCKNHGQDRIAAYAIIAFLAATVISYCYTGLAIYYGVIYHRRMLVIGLSCLMIISIKWIYILYLM